MRLGRLQPLLLVAALAGGCVAPAGASPSGTPEASPSAVALTPGQPIDAGPRPDAIACRLELAAEVDAAQRIRSDLHVDGIPSTDSAVQAAAADLSADVTTLGIPLRSNELAALQASGIAMDRQDPLRYRVNVGEPSRFGGFWVDPPGSGRLVVAILNSDHGALALARCLDDGVDVRYVAATRSVADELALDARIGADMSELRSSGIAIQSVGIGVRASVTVVIVGVTGATDAIRARLIARYGASIVVEEQGPITPT